MKYADIILKFLAVLTGVFCIVYGALGFIGLNPAGTHEEWWIKLAGLLMMFLGILYLYPNSKIIHKKLRNIYYFICAVPIMIVFICAFVTIYQSDWSSFIFQGGLETTIGVSIFASFAPGSLYLYEKKLLSNRDN